jgi:LAO/AO transport system kinase
MSSCKPTLWAQDLARIEALVSRMRAGERRAISSAATELERQGATMPALLAALRPYLGHALVVGFTGPPGVGKSTLVDAYVSKLRQANRTVGIIAVDPSSPISGGAILGDRIRMRATLDDDGVFMRSLASRGHLGGLSPAAVRIIDALDAAGKDFVILETVGAGQSEIDVAAVADVRIVMAAPGLGDDIQAMKSGLFEVADILVVNKADREGAEATFQHLSATLALRSNRADVPVLKTVATSGDGVAALDDAIAKIGHRRMAKSATQRRRQRGRYLIAQAAVDVVTQRIRTRTGSEFERLVDGVLDGVLSPKDAAAKLLAP